MSYSISWSSLVEEGFVRFGIASCSEREKDVVAGSEGRGGTVCARG